ncbi:MAG: Holliday junction branch migration protein RuvA [Mycoplasma sp.]|nr:Holliday junction branch migration protein RuvA [Mycoplasma sp.]
MKIWKIGKVIYTNKNYVVFESNYTGWIINVINPEEFPKEEVIKLYVYEHKNDYTTSLYGFKNIKERILFTDLISINGVGPKSAQSILKQGFGEIINSIINGDAKELSEAPMVGFKTARQIIFELQDKYINMDKKVSKSKKTNAVELKDTLKMLGFKTNQINMAIEKIEDFNINIEQLVEKSIRIISSAK